MKPNEYIRDLFDEHDKIALVLIPRGEDGKTQQRIWTAGKASSDAVQRWLRHSNAHGSDIYVSMNPLHPEARRRSQGRRRRSPPRLPRPRPGRLEEAREGAQGRLRPQAPHAVLHRQLVEEPLSGDLERQARLALERRRRNAHARAGEGVRRGSGRDGRFTGLAAARIQASRAGRLDQDERHRPGAGAPRTVAAAAVSGAHAGSAGDRPLAWSGYPLRAQRQGRLGLHRDVEQ